MATANVRGFEAVDRRGVRGRYRSNGGILVSGIAVAGVAWFLANDWLAAAGILCLWGIWYLLRAQDHPPVIRVALTFHWTQITCGIYYYALTGREVEAMYASDYRPMVLLGLGCLVALTAGLLVGLRLVKQAAGRPQQRLSHAFTWQLLMGSWLASIFVQAFLRELAWSVPGLTQGLLAIGYLRLGILFLVFRRLVRPQMRWAWFFGILSVELALGFTGYFAGFREPLVLASLALVEAFDKRSLAHWVRLAWIGAAGLLAGALWMGIRTSYRAQYNEATSSRAERLERIGTLSSEWLERETAAFWGDADKLVERVWAIYYPAIAVSRVPDVLPHENGALLFSALKHIVTPRLLFPNKGTLPSDSELVRKYTGVFVAGADQNTSIAFGYAAESYVDFGVPIMFLPSFVFGIVMGVAYNVLNRVIHHRELSIAVVCVVFWMSLYLFERSWIKTLGLTGTLLIYVGGVVWLVDRRLRGRRIANRPRGLAVRTSRLSR